MFIVNLAISDSGIMFSQGPLMFINAFNADHWMWGPFVCKLYGCLGGIFGKKSHEMAMTKISMLQIDEFF